MVRLGSSCALVLALLLARPLPGQTAEATFVPLTVWQPDLGGARTEATPETLVLRSGTIRTRAIYSDFILRFDYRVPAPKGGATLLLRARFDYGRSVRGFAVALGDGPDRGRLSTEAQSLHALPVDAPAPTGAGGAWTRCEIRAQGETLTVSLDGTVVSRADRLDEFAGHIGFAARGSDGIELRHVSLASLEPPDDAFPSDVPAVPPRVGNRLAEVVAKAPPFYPVAARDQGITGMVLLDVVIGADGRIAAARVKNSPHPDLAVSALGCVRKWRFKPALNAGVPVPMTATIEVAFNLKR